MDKLLSVSFKIVNNFTCTCITLCLKKEPVYVCVPWVRESVCVCACKTSTEHPGWNQTVCLGARWKNQRDSLVFNSTSCDTSKWCSQNYTIKICQTSTLWKPACEHCIVKMLTTPSENREWFAMRRRRPGTGLRLSLCCLGKEQGIQSL